MTVRWRSSRAWWSALALVAMGAGCQTDPPPDDDEQTPPATVRREVGAEPQAPEVVLLVDKSGSMSRPADPTSPACRVASGPDDTCGTLGTPRCDEAVCPTRLGRLKEAVGGFLAPSGEASFPVRTALTVYPLGGQCLAPEAVLSAFPRSEAPDELEAAARAADAVVQAILDDPSRLDFGNDVIGGGTPTAESLRSLARNLPSLQTPGGRARFVLLLTDGLPNCNQDIPTTAEACRCILADPSLCFPSDRVPLGIPTGCLDDLNTVAAIRELAQAGVKTLVVGVGDELASELATETLQAMGTAGGYQRSCEMSSDGDIRGAS